MQANGTNFRSIMEGTRQYIVPLFQRTYSWQKKDIDTLWDDIEGLYELGPGSTKEHFIGSFVAMPDNPTPNISRFILIDGQQRMTTLLLFLAAIRSVAAQRQQPQVAAAIRDTFLVNPYAPGYMEKFVPTQADRAEFQALVDDITPATVTSQPLKDAYDLAKKHVAGKDGTGQPFDLERLRDLVVNSLSLVSITLSATDSPYVIFQSLNGTGADLTQADLIRNYFFMRLPLPRQQPIYDTTWLPMQDALSGKGQLPDFFRHYLSKDGTLVNYNDLYDELKKRADKECPTNVEIEAYILDTARFAKHYRKVLLPSQEADPDVANRLNRLNKWGVTVAYPLILNLYEDYDQGRLNAAQFTEMLADIESFVVRRYFCGIPTNRLNRIFVTAYRSTEPPQGSTADQRVGTLRQYFYALDWPDDARFKAGFLGYELYKDASRCSMTLRLLEVAEGHHEVVGFDVLTIEHIMPQTLTSAWEQMLGIDFARVHAQYLHAIGNLTLTGYNPTLSNADFPTKQAIYASSNVTLNSYFAPLTQWAETEIVERGDYLAAHAAKIWERP